MRQDFIEIDRAIAVAASPLDLAVIIPTFNEAENIQPLLARLSIALAELSWEAIFVDDNSPDGTSEIVRQIALENRNVRIIQRIGRRGLSSAVVEGMLSTAAPIFAVIDGDMQHDESILQQLYEKISRDQADIAIGTRYANGGSTGNWAADRRRISRIATQIGQFVLKTDISDPMTGFFVTNRKTLMAAMPRLSGVGFKILLDILASLPEKPRVAEVPYTFRTRMIGESKADTLAAVEFLSLLVDKTIGRFIPLRLLSFLAVGGLGLGVHLILLRAALGLGAAFMTAQTIAVIVAMTFNFFLNNVLTYRDKRLTGWKMATGLISFYAVCSIGALANIGIGTWVSGQDSRWWIAGVSGVLIGAVWNYAASSFITWRK